MDQAQPTSGVTWTRTTGETAQAQPGTLEGGFLLCLNQPTVSKRSCGYLRIAEPQAAGLMCIPWLPQHFSSPAGTCWQSDSQAG